MILLSIDPGVEKTGYAIFDKTVGKPAFTYLNSGLIKTKRTLLHEKRLHEIYVLLEDVIKKNKPDHIILEKLFFFNNQKTAIQVAQSQGVILLLAAQHDIPVTFLTPLQIKQIITGYGNADKKSVQKMLSLLLKQEIHTMEDDQSDAIACGLAYCYINQLHL